jgi:shikimate kinase
MQKKSIVYIIGFMGSGKTTAGEKLASSLGWQFVDLDREIEKNEGKTIPQIFSQHGEGYFRAVETETLRSLGAGRNTIISTGGGTPCYDDNMDFMLQTGVTVYLKMTPPQLAGRLMKETDDRPLLKNIPDDKLVVFIEEKLKKREKWYNRSNIIINGMDLNIKDLHAAVKTSLISLQ